MNEPSRHHFKSIAYAGQRPGPRLIITGAVHGNETCGTRAIGRVVQEIDTGALAILAGGVTFVPVTNPLAYARGERTGDRNLNRNLTPTDRPADFEDHVGNWLCPLLARHDALLDLHSTRALAQHLGVHRFVDGWLGTYAKGVARRIEALRAGGREHNPLTTDPRYGVGTTEYMRSAGGYAITLECGQHDDPASPEVGYRAIRNALAFLGIGEGPPPAPVEAIESLSLHDVIDRAHAGDTFSRAWSSFDRLTRGERIGTRHDGTPVVAENDGYIVFPDAKAEAGNEWFYLARANG